MRKIKKEDLEALISDDTLSMKMIADILGVSKTTIRDSISYYKLSYNSKKGKIRPTASGIDWSTEKDNLRKLIEDEKKTYEEVSKLYNVSISSIADAVSRYGISYSYTKYNALWEESEDRILKDLFLKGLSYQEILDSNLLPTRTIESISDRARALGLKYLGCKRYQFTPEIISKAKDLLKLGKTIKQVAIELNYKSNLGTFRRALKNRIDPKFWKEFVKDKEVFNISKESLEHDVYVLGLTVKQIAEKYNTTKDIISHNQRNFGIKHPKKEKLVRTIEDVRVVHPTKYLALEKFYGRTPTISEVLSPLEKTLTKEYLEKFYQAYDYSDKKVASNIGLSESEVSKLRRAFNIVLPKTPKLKDYPDSFYYEKYVVECLSYEEIGKITGLSSESIRKYIHKILGKHILSKNSIGERMVEKSLKELGIHYEKHVKYDNIADPYRKRVLIDFIVKYDNKEYWIEVNGEQHYSLDYYTTLCRSAEPLLDNFLVVLNRDRKVRTYARNNGLIFVEIPYTIKSKKEIKDFLSKVILDNIRADELIDLSPFYEMIKSYGVNPIDIIPDSQK